MPLTLNNTNTLTTDNSIIGGTELSLIYATKNEIGNNAQISTDTGDIATLNTKQLQNLVILMPLMLIQPIIIKLTAS